MFAMCSFLICILQTDWQRNRCRCQFPFVPKKKMLSLLLNNHIYVKHLLWPFGFTMDPACTSLFIQELWDLPHQMVNDGLVKWTYHFGDIFWYRKSLERWHAYICVLFAVTWIMEFNWEQQDFDSPCTQRYSFCIGWLYWNWNDCFG